MARKRRRVRRVKEFVRHISHEERIHVRIEKENGTVTSWVFSYEIEISGRSINPCRIDNAHGYAHVDAETADGQPFGEKQPLGQCQPEQAAELLEEILIQHRRRVLGELGLPAD
jgi:hypothetical protein